MCRVKHLEAPEGSKKAARRERDLPEHDTDDRSFSQEPSSPNREKQIVATCGTDHTRMLKSSAVSHIDSDSLFLTFDNLDVLLRGEGIRSAEYALPLVGPHAPSPCTPKDAIDRRVLAVPARSALGSPCERH